VVRPVESKGVNIVLHESVVTGKPELLIG